MYNKLDLFKLQTSFLRTIDKMCYNEEDPFNFLMQITDVFYGNNKCNLCHFVRNK